MQPATCQIVYGVLSLTYSWMHIVLQWHIKSRHKALCGLSIPCLLSSMHAKNRGAVLHVMTLKAYLTSIATHCSPLRAAKVRFASCEVLSPLAARCRGGSPCKCQSLNFCCCVVGHSDCHAWPTWVWCWGCGSVSTVAAAVQLHATVEIIMSLGGACMQQPRPT